MRKVNNSGKHPCSGKGIETIDALEELKRENAALRERFSALGAASLRVSASLDVDTVLQEIVDSARTLAGARYAVIRTVNDEGELQDFVTSGFAEDERRAYMRSLELAPLPIRSKNVKGTPMRHYGRHVGDFLVGEKVGGGNFTTEDERVLVLFAHHAATAIANARAHRAEQRARADLEALERQRTESLNLVSHELRTPLAAIKGSTATLLGVPAKLDPAEMRAFHRIIDEQVEQMRELVAYLLDAGRVETGTLPVSPEPSDVGVLVEQARSTFSSGGARHAVRVDLACDLPRVMVDRRRIVQVLNNLISNAARHSPDGSPIRVAAQREGVYVAVSVSDEGTGVAPEQLPHLFREYSGTASDQGSEGIGRGLGLAICKGLVEAHGGRIWAESAGVGQGTRVAFTIPVVEARGDAERAVMQPASLGSGARPNGARVLVVDDDPHTLRFVLDALSDAGYTVLVTDRHHELSRIIGVERPDLVLLDLVLPGVDGIELMEGVPALANPDLPVIFISGYGRDETIARALESGAADYIVKPFSPTELVARVRSALRRRAEPEPFVLGELAIHYAERRVTVAGRTIELTATEYELLRVLAANAGRVATYDALLRQVWAGRANADAEVVRAFVKSLRRKLGEDAKKPSYLFNLRGVGYRLRAP